MSTARLPRGVDWNDERTQRIRFEQLLDLVAGVDEPFSLIDYGCGYGALVDSLAEAHAGFAYAGLRRLGRDDRRGAQALRRRAARAGSRATAASSSRPTSRSQAGSSTSSKTRPRTSGRAYVLDTIDELAAPELPGLRLQRPHRSRRPGASHAPISSTLTRQRCSTTASARYSRDVVLRHDYELYEFTLLVYLDRRPPGGWRAERGGRRHLRHRRLRADRGASTSTSTVRTRSSRSPCTATTSTATS